MLQDQTSFEPKTAPKAWTSAEVARLMRMRRDGLGWPEIAEALGRTESGVRSRFKYANHAACVSGPEKAFQREPVPDSVLAEQARRICAPFRDLAGAVFGDPPIGSSALDQRVRA